jgi:hypothetical protein
MTWSAMQAVLGTVLARPGFRLDMIPEQGFCWRSGTVFILRRSFS